MPKYRQLPIEVEAIRLEYRTLIQTPEGAMSAEAGDYLETIRVGDNVHQRIVPAWVFEAGHLLDKGKGKKPNRFIALPENGDQARVGYQIIPAELVYTEPHDGYPLTKE